MLLILGRLVIFSNLRHLENERQTWTISKFQRFVRMVVPLSEYTLKLPKFIISFNFSCYQVCLHFVTYLNQIVITLLNFHSVWQLSLPASHLLFTFLAKKLGDEKHIFVILHRLADTWLHHISYYVQNILKHIPSLSNIFNSVSRFPKQRNLTQADKESLFSTCVPQRPGIFLATLYFMQVS